MLRRPRTLAEALKYPRKHKHKWKDWQDGVKFCTVCGFPIVKAAAEASTDCNHKWVHVDVDGGTPHVWRAKCETCGYFARGMDYSKWFKRFKKWEMQFRPRCLVCREPVMREASICENCKLVQPQVIL